MVSKVTINQLQLAEITYTISDMLASNASAQTSKVLGSFSQRLRTLFGPAKPFLIVCILKTKGCIGMKLCMNRNFVRIKNV